MADGEWVAIVEIVDPDERVDEAQLVVWIADGLQKMLPPRLRTKVEIREVERA